jgi:DNA-binding NarL/FixJ family response regulator
MIRIALVDDNMVNRRTLRQALRHNARYGIVMEAQNGRDFLDWMETLAEEGYPDLVLMDLDMPVMGGVETIAVATMKYPGVKYLVITVFDDDDKLFDAIRAGASGYILKEDVSELLDEAISTLHDLNGAPMSPAIARKTLELLKYSAQNPSTKQQEGTHLLGALTEREQEVLRLLVEGRNYRKIAEILTISPQTVRKHVGHIYEKLHINSKAEAILLAHKYKWI